MPRSPVLQVLIVFLISAYPSMKAFGSKSYSEPIFELEYSVSDVKVEARLNDIPVLTYSEKSTGSSRRPVPEFIIDGRNTVSLNVSPLEGDEYKEGAFVDVHLLVRDKEAPLNETDTLLHLSVKPEMAVEKIASASGETLGGEIEIKKHGQAEMIVLRSVEIDSPFPGWAWHEGSLIDKNKDNFDSLFKEYEKTYNALRSKDLDKIKEIYFNAAKEYATAYHREDATDGYNIMNAGGHLGDEEWVVGDIHKLAAKRDYELQVFANGKLARIVDTPNMRSPIMYLNKESRLIDCKRSKIDPLVRC